MELSADQIRAMLTTPMALGEAVPLAGVLVREPLILEMCDVSSVDFSGAVFQEPVIFCDVVFTGLSWFKACVFKAGVDFSRSTFTNDARFDGSTLAADFCFVKSEVLGASDFRDCVVHGATTMDHTTFCGSLSFEGAEFRNKMSLRRVECLGGLWTERALFAGAIDVSGMDVHGRAWLRNRRSQVGRDSGDSRKLEDIINCYGYQWS
jgi:Pentapeptide repeats (9 copies)